MRRFQIALLFGLTLLITVLLIWWRFDQDIKAASARAAQGGKVIATRCGPIEYQEAGVGTPLLMVHGSGGGHDQGMAFAGALAQQGIRVIAMSRFGYLRTPMPTDASPAAQADAHACSTHWEFGRQEYWAHPLARHPRCRQPSVTLIASTR
jgi:2-hydroxy-6-oxonona-2,4-dienedioate hydrolase